MKSARCDSQVENQYWRDLALARGRAGAELKKKTDNCDSHCVSGGVPRKCSRVTWQQSYMATSRVTPGGANSSILRSGLPTRFLLRLDIRTTLLVLQSDQVVWFDDHSLHDLVPLRWHVNRLVGRK